MSCFGCDVCRFRFWSKTDCFMALSVFLWNISLERTGWVIRPWLTLVLPFVAYHIPFQKILLFKRKWFSSSTSPVTCTHLPGNRKNNRLSIYDYFNEACIFLTEKMLIPYSFLDVVVCLGLTSLLTIFQSYHIGVRLQQRAQCSLLKCCLTEVSCPRLLISYHTQSYCPDTGSISPSSTS